jgi:16S rRNA processing protein RimM
LQPLPEGTYYLHQLVGCRVETVDGATVGDVTRVDGGAAAAVLMVASAHGDVLVPLAQEICVGIDVGARLIRVRMPEGLLELNETKAPRSRPAKPRKGKSRRAERGKEIL